MKRFLISTCSFTWILFAACSATAWAAGPSFTQNYGDFYSDIYKFCDKSAQALGISPGCNAAIKLCLKDYFTCVNEGHGCTLRETAGSEEIQCELTVSECKKPDATALFTAYKSQQPSNKCPAPTEVVSANQPGCGNNVVEPNEKCDEGSLEGNTTCPKNCGIEEKAVAENAPVPAGANPAENKNTTGDQAASCALRSGGTDPFQGRAILPLLFSFLFIFWRERRTARH